jgi:16S rRNA (cytosine967-C5)-methyltransferase
MTSARAVALRALVSLAKGRANRLRAVLDLAPLEPREMAFAYELAHGVLRNERMLDFALATCAHRGLPEDPLLRSALRLGAHQLLFVAGMPPHAAVHATVALVRHNQGFANAVLRRLANMVEARAADAGKPLLEIALSPSRTLVLPPPGLPADPAAALAIRHSLPDFLVQRWQARLSAADLQAVCAASNATPDVFLRAANRCPDAASLVARLDLEGVRCEPTEHPRLARWVAGGSPFATKAFAEGLFLAQDLTAVRAAELVPVQPGMTVVDLCAAPGTKTTLLAERVRPGGLVFAYDRDPVRSRRITENSQRLGLLEWIRVVTAVAQLPSADVVLVDAPCSNTGVLARRVEVRRRISPESFAELAPVQRELLQQAGQLVRPGGTVAYSTCSIEPEENGELVRAALPTGFTITAEVTTLPRVGRGDGGYVALLVRQPQSMAR